MMNKIMLLFLTMLIVGCGIIEPNPLVKYGWELDVTYTDGTSEKMSLETKSTRSDYAIVYLDSDFGCIKVYWGSFEHKTHACGVRRFEVLSETKTILDEDENED